MENKKREFKISRPKVSNTEFIDVVLPDELFEVFFNYDGIEIKKLEDNVFYIIVRKDGVNYEMTDDFVQEMLSIFEKLHEGCAEIINFYNCKLDKMY